MESADWFTAQAAKIYASPKCCWGKWFVQVMTPYALLPESEQAYDRRKATELNELYSSALSLDELAAKQHHFWRCCRVRAVLGLPPPDPMFWARVCKVDTADLIHAAIPVISQRPELIHDPEFSGVVDADLVEITQLGF